MIWHSLSFVLRKKFSHQAFFLNYIFPDTIRSLEDNVPLSVLLDGFNLFSMHRAVITEAHCMLGLMINVNPVMYMSQMLYAGQSARPSVPFLSDF